MFCGVPDCGVDGVHGDVADREQLEGAVEPDENIDEVLLVLEVSGGGMMLECGGVAGRVEVSIVRWIAFMERLR